MVDRATDELNAPAYQYTIQGGAPASPAAGFIKNYHTASGYFWVDSGSVVHSVDDNDVILDPDSSVRNLIQPTGGDYTPLTLRGYATLPAANLFVIKKGDTGANVFVIDDDGATTIFREDTARSGQPLNVYGYWIPGVSGAGNPRAVYGLMEWDGTNNLSSGFMTAFSGETDIDSTGIGDVHNFNSKFKNFGAGTIGAVAHYWVESSTNSGGGAITNEYGFYCEDLIIATNSYPIYTNAGNIVLNAAHGAGNVNIGGTPVSSNYDLALLGDGVLAQKETTAPTADTGYGKTWWQNDNKYYGQDGAGETHILFGVPTFKSYTITTQGLGASPDVYAAGFYEFSAADATLDQTPTTQAFGNANVSYAAHAFAVVGGAGSVDTGVVGLRVNGTSITDAGVRTTSDTETIIADITAVSLNDYFETTKKWLGTITYELFAVSGAPTTYSLDINYGYAKYEDFGNNDFKVTDVEVVGFAGGNDTAVDAILIYHRDSNWVYHATAFTPIVAANKIASLQGDHTSTDDQVANAQHFAWKRSGLTQEINGNDSQGVMVLITTTSINTLEYANIHIGVEY
jgi:hypothetical protein